MINLTAHESRATLPCLCKGCFENAPTEASAGGVAFKRIAVTVEPRVLYAWFPLSLAHEEAALVKSMQQRLVLRTAKAWPRPTFEPLVQVRANQPKTEAPGLWARVRSFFARS